MALFDAKSKFCDDQDISGGAGSTASTDVVDLTADDRGEGSPLAVEAYLTSAPAGGTSLQVSIQDSANGSTGWADIVGGEVLTLAQLQALKKGKLPTLYLPSVHEQYVRLNFTRVGTFTTLDATAGIVQL